MELLVFHRAGASEEQDRLHGARELRGTDDKGTCLLRVALSLLQPAYPGEIFENNGLAKEKQF